MHDCLIVTHLAEDFCAEVKRLSAATISARACTSAAEARQCYDGEAVVFGNPEMIAEVLPAMPNIQWVQSSWAGVTPLIDLDRRDYQLTGVRGVFGAPMSEYVLTYLLAHELKLLRRVDAQRAHQWYPELSGTLQGKHLGIMGTGSIGQHIARTCKQFGMNISGFSRTAAPRAGFDRVFSPEDLAEFLAPLDYVVCVLPNTPATTGLLDAAALSHLADHAYLINVGRSNVLDDDAVIAALENGRLAGAALDVFDTEPLPSASRLWDVPNLTITGHVAAVSHPMLIVPLFVDNFERYRKGEPLENVIDFDAGY